MPRLSYETKEATIPFLFTTPQTTGHGSLPAAIAAVASELDFGKHYFIDGEDVTADEITERLRTMGAEYEVNGEVPAPISFCRSHGATRPDEFRIAKRHESLAGKPYDSLTEGGGAA